MFGLIVASFIVPLAVAGACLLLVVVYVISMRLFGPRFIDYHGAMVVAEPPSTAIGRVEQAVGAQRNYTYRRIGADRLEVIHSSLERDLYATDPSPEAAEAFLDMLRVTASPVAAGTEIRLVGRAEARLINAVRTELGHARMPRLQGPAWMRGG